MAARPRRGSASEGSRRREEQGPSSRRDSGVVESMLQDVLYVKMTELVEFLLQKYCAKQPTTKAEMLSSVIKEHQDHFPEILRSASECLQLVFGVDVKNVDPTDHSYVLVTTLGLTYDGMVSEGQSVPNTGLLIMVLRVILLEGDCASEEKVWEALKIMGVRAGRKHYIYGEPKELLTKVWVQEQYLVYRQVRRSNTTRYEFLWGPRAHAETSKAQVLECFDRDDRRDPSSAPSLSEGAVSGEEGGQGQVARRQVSGSR